MSKIVILKPRMSEKSYAASTALNTYVFDVPLGINKLQIAQAVEAQFNVHVNDVRTTIIKGKEARSIRIGGKARANVSGKRSDIKKAYVTVKEGDSIPVFAALDEQTAKQEKIAETLDKKSKKESK